MPAGLWSKTQFTYVEVKTSRQISRARIHVERSIGYLKRYKILKNRVQRKMLPYLSKIMFVLAMITNMDGVFLKELDKDFSESYQPLLWCIGYHPTHRTNISTTTQLTPGIDLYVCHYWLVTNYATANTVLTNIWP